MGNSEKLLGSLIKDSKEKIIISKKYAPNKKNQKGKMGESLSNSIERLKIEAPDIYIGFIIQITVRKIQRKSSSF